MLCLYVSCCWLRVWKVFGPSMLLRGAFGTDVSRCAVWSRLLRCMDSTTSVSESECSRLIAGNPLIHPCVGGQCYACPDIVGLGSSVASWRGRSSIFLSS